jgi:hypothetical protein
VLKVSLPVDLLQKFALKSASVSSLNSPGCLARYSGGSGALFGVTTTSLSSCLRRMIDFRSGVSEQKTAVNR